MAEGHAQSSFFFSGPCFLFVGVFFLFVSVLLASFEGFVFEWGFGLVGHLLG